MASPTESRYDRRGGGWRATLGVAVDPEQGAMITNAGFTIEDLRIGRAGGGATVAQVAWSDARPRGRR